MKEGEGGGESKMSKDKRRDFKEWAVREVYVRQEGTCFRCGCSLKKGFVRHHVDGNPANNDPSNLMLLCEDCHYSTFKADEWSEHKELERDVLASLHEGLHKVLEKELSGAALERMILAASKILSISRQEKGLSTPAEQLPEFHFQESALWADGWVEGLKKGLEMALKKVAEEE